MILIPEGWFWMGSEGHYSWESPRHRVYVDAFEIAPASVTRREYGAFVRETARSSPRGWDDPAFSDPEQPVVGVNWFDAAAYCAWLSERAGELFRLPTEAEWEKACRGGLESVDYAWGDTAPQLLPYFQNVQGPWTGPRRAAEGPQNGFGLFHIGDNVHEWCADWFEANYYALAPEKNPAGPEAGTRRVSRGGSWRHQVKASRAAHRSSLDPTFRYTDYGFRCVRQVQRQED